MRFRSIIIASLLAVMQFYGNLWASPTTAYEAEMVVTGWLKANPLPFNTVLDRKVSKVKTFTNDSGEPVYNIVYLDPSGFVIVSADDSIEPIIGFADDGVYDHTSENPLGTLVTKDLNARTISVRNTFKQLAVTEQFTSNRTQQKWSSLINLASVLSEGFQLTSDTPICDSSISDIRVAPLVQGKWDQSWYSDEYHQKHACYNYYTPQLVDNRVSFVEDQIENYPCGCVATTMAQLMRFHEYPTEAVEPTKFTINVEWRTTERWLLRGNGPNGRYNWSDMVLIPDYETTNEQRSAIGAICHDAGISINTIYTENGSGAFLHDVPKALVDTFGFHQAMWGANEGKNIDRQDLIEMINPNLDASSPVILGILNSSNPERGHAVICDGYGYNSSTLYHHINIGWDGLDDCWYNLPNVVCSNDSTYDTIVECIYNIFTDCIGEIISGRICNKKDQPIKNAVVTALQETNGDIHTTVTNNKGIYAFKDLASYSNYTITADKNGYDFQLREVDTERSYDGSTVSGNKWGINFHGYSNCVTVPIGTGTSEWDYPMHTFCHDSRTQVIYPAGEIGTSGTITALALNVIKAPDEPMENCTIRMKHTTMSEYATPSLDATGWTIVYQNDESVDTGWYTFEFQTPFEYNGMDNLLVDFSHNNSSSDENGLCRTSRPGPMRSVYACSDSQHGNPLNWPATNPPTMYCSGDIPNVKFMIGRESQVIKNKLIAFDGQAGDRFGFSVSIHGDYAIVGAPGPDENDNISGSAYIFKREGLNWTQQAKLTAFPPAYSDYFGCAVSINDDYAVIGACGNDVYLGSAYVFKREGTNWIQQTELTGQVNRIGLGNSVLISGDYAIIGDPKYLKRGTKRYSNNQYGAAYIYKLEGTNWIQQAILINSVSQLYDRFGSAVSINGDYAVVGAKIGSGKAEGSGTAYIFNRVGTDWTRQTRLIASDGSINDLFGSAVSISGDFALIGAPQEDAVGVDSGSAYLFKREGTNWIQREKLFASDGSFGDKFGSSISISGNLAVIGSPNDDDDIYGSDCGSVYLFKSDGVRWTQQKKLTALNPEIYNNFGSSVSIGGDYIIIGAEGDNDNGSNSGSAYIFRLDNISGI